MVRNVRKHVNISDSPSVGDLAPKHLKREEFARRLYQLMVSKGWRQVDLVRHSGVPKYAISVYMNAKVIPTTDNLSKLAAAFDLRPEELLPNHLEEALVEATPAFEMKVSNDAPGFAWVRVNRLVSTANAVKIAEILQHDDAFNRSGNSGAAQVQQVESEAPAVEREAPLPKRAARTR